jgi:hypothetical protein
MTSARTEHWLSRLLAPLAARLGRSELRGLLGVLLIFLPICAIHVLGVPPFAPLDEPRHIAYAIEVAEGKLPDVRDKVSLKKLHVRRIKGTNMQAAAAHPPLYYVLVGLPLKWSSESGDLAWGTRVSRAITLGLGAAGLIYAYLAASLLVPRARSAALLGTAFCALMPAFDNVSSLVHNDSLAFLTTSALLYATMLVLQRGATWRSLALVSIWAALAAGTRFAALVAVAPALTAVGIKLLTWQKPWSVRLRWAAAFSVATLLLIAVTSGWFYWRNYRLYDDVTAGKALFEGLKRPIRTPYLVSVSTPKLWGKLVSDLWGRLAGGVTLGKDVAALGIGFVVTGFGLALVRWLVTLRRHGRALLANPRLSSVVFVIVTAACVVLPIFEFYSRGGNLTARYYFPVLWVPLLAVAVGYTSLPGKWAGALALVFCTGLGLWCTDLYLEKLMRRPRGWAIARAFELAEVPAAQLCAVVLISLIIVGMALVAHSWWVLRSEEQRGARVAAAVGDV